VPDIVIFAFSFSFRFIDADENILLLFFYIFISHKSTILEIAKVLSVWIKPLYLALFLVIFHLGL
jgi:hypothetical protein